MSKIARDVIALTRLPRGEQLARLQALRTHHHDALPQKESWNSRFGPDSLFDAWTSSTFCRRIYAANAEVLADRVRPGFRFVEIGGGDGKLWQSLLPADAEGELVLVDPAAEVHTQVPQRLPPNVSLVSHVAPVEEVDLPEADAVVCSLTLHHVAGRTAAERAAVGLTGPGKQELLAAMGASVAAARGLVLLNEADVYCELALPPGSAQLRDHLLDSYVRRCGLGLATTLLENDLEPSLAARTEAILLRWCLDQLAVAELPIAERDVYELDVERWLEVLSAAGLEVQTHRFTDRWRLFHQYVATPR